MAKKLNLSQWHILVIDDDEPGAMVTADILRLFKANVYTALSGSIALSMVEVLPKLTAVLLDLKMPMMSGWELRDRLHTLPALNSTAIIAVTACASETDRLHVSTAGFDGYIAKPFLIDSFLNALLNSIAHKKGLKSIYG